ncbi:uncharacterized protein NECHADRAFT_88979 [Fusarium vanettenii 77-13-4]|uniref:Uncharacterized protein n=1 Tax=Fusarium vanettenii (strain ATCC MYA-4622 / CBS 123669 / FGSC 9596 / NRRL 45880 / 77-13-4) TaxID=660122 RepID=C7ZN22_FUSV7|nr:uncharacterized protein NECHADRAFT_88979 [Fusarium vanettenii 77-13-4]EEU34578.1 predicted protein [Fusarium vanettenii 77-13-4]
MLEVVAATQGEDGYNKDKGPPNDINSNYFSQYNNINPTIQSPWNIEHHRSESSCIKEPRGQTGQQGHDEGEAGPRVRAARPVPQPPAASRLENIPEATPTPRPSGSEADEERALYEQITIVAYMIRINVSNEVECPKYRNSLTERLVKAAKLPDARTFTLLIESALSVNP